MSSWLNSSILDFEVSPFDRALLRSYITYIYCQIVATESLCTSLRRWGGDSLVCKCASAWLQSFWKFRKTSLIQLWRLREFLRHFLNRSYKARNSVSSETRMAFSWSGFIVLSLSHFIQHGSSGYTVCVHSESTCIHTWIFRRTFHTKCKGYDLF